MVQKLSELFLLGLILTVFIASAMGLANSVDTPQYFTTEALIQNQNVDMLAFLNDPHFFVQPDYFYHEGQIMNVRGYTTSVLAIPFHWAAQPLQHVLNTSTFPTSIQSPNFSYELGITMLLTITSAIGLLFLFKALMLTTRNLILSGILTLATAFGTYIWKYSSFYTRSGFVILILGLLTYTYVRLSQQKSLFLSGIAGFVHGLLFGVDPILFIAMSIFFVAAVGTSYLSQKDFLKKYKLPVWNVDLPVYLISGAAIIILITLGNIYFYDSPAPTHVDKWHPAYSIIGEETGAFVISGPVLPVVWTALFSMGPPPESAFSHYDNYPVMYEKLHVYFAQVYNFYGLFIIAPFLLFGALLILFPKTIRKHLYVLLFSVSIFALCIAGNAKIFEFWAGNQYDIRYFYPFAMLLVLPTGLAINELIKLRKDKKHAWALYLILTIFSATILISLLMGWLGVINMYRPALTGERRIWLEIHNLFVDFSKYSYADYIDATFMNRYNAWIGISLAALTVLLSSIVFELLPNKHSRMRLQSRKRGKEE